jgi:F-type H+-transporting ATPase subunit delta
VSPNMSTTYAQALVQAALGDWIEQLTTIQRNLRRNPDLAAVLSDANAVPTDRETAIGRILPANAAPEVVQFVRLLARQGDLRLLGDVVRHVREAVPSLDDASNVVVTSAHELSSSERDRLEAKLQAEHGADIRVRYEVDPDLLGGLRIRIGDRVMDHTVAARLDALRGRLVS